MLYRKISKTIEEHLTAKPDKILIVDGARQVGKSFIIRYIGQKTFENYIEIDLAEDFLGQRLFENVKSVNDFYFQVSMIAGEKMKERDNTLIFLDEIQTYPHLLTLLKFLQKDGRYTYIASGSLLGVTLSKTSSIPMGSIRTEHMYPLDLEEFLYANGFNEGALNTIKDHFINRKSLDEATHNKILDLFKKYLLVGGMPDAVNSFLQDHNIVNIRKIQSEIREYYSDDASKYDREKKLKIKRIYDMIPSALCNKKKRMVAKDIEDKKGKTFANYKDEFDYLINAGIALEVKALTTPVFPLVESSGKNLLKLYLNDVGILSGILYGNNIRAIMDDVPGINLGTVYESVVSSELKAHGKRLYYYDNRNNGEVDFLIDDHENLSALPIEVKSGKDYKRHSALNKLLSNPSYNINSALVLSNNRKIECDGAVLYMPIYFIMFI